MSPPLEPPFALAHQLCRELDEPSGSSSERCLPGYPYISLQKCDEVLKFLDKELRSEDLDRMADKFWWMSKQDSSNISPLHRQLVKQRAVVVTEDPKLHLIWIHDRIFIKPLPRYILSYPFWRDYIGNGRDHAGRVRRAALGYLRTYSYLIRYESDFRMAQDPKLHLIPPDVSWEQFCRFASDVAKIADADVSERYAYGEIRLTRLNFYAPLLLRKSYFQRVDYQYGEYFARFYGPILFMIGLVSIVLSALQVLVAVEQNGPTRNNQLSSIALGFSVAMVLCFCIIFLCLGALLIYKIAKEWKFAIRDRLRLLEDGRA
ncbi:hypothetical protein F4779DRAFT_578084 [Xylariaceae sp. FL0662B]|nr:hypothetical protein F4779DRAFT_578084 [Xylariaceae sp. FL0662B]